jgi:putative ABC transport system permease protein
VVLDVFAPHPVLWIAPLGMLLLGAVAGLLPAWKAYATDVADNLAPAT